MMLQLKLEAPRQPPSIVERPRLLSALSGARVILLSAPAGFGKTTTLVQWRNHLLGAGELVGWLTLDEAVSEVRKAGGRLGSVRLHPGSGRTATVKGAQAGGGDDDGVHLEVSVGASEAAQTDAIAAVLASTQAAAEIGVAHKEGAAAWLKEHRLTSVERITEVVTLEDDGLRDWFRLDAGGAIDAVREVLRAADRLIRKI